MVMASAVVVAIVIAGIFGESFMKPTTSPPPSEVLLTLAVKDGDMVITRPDYTYNVQFNVKSSASSAQVRFTVVTNEPYVQRGFGIPDESGNGRHPVYLAGDPRDGHNKHRIIAELISPQAPNVAISRTVVENVVRTNSCSDPSTGRQIPGSQQ